MNAVFGSHWLPDLPLVPTPVGQACGWCDEPIAEGDEGEIIPHMGSTPKPWHRECRVRAVRGSVGHQLGRCSCCGGTEGDPPGMTKREAARAALHAFKVHL